jgi:hypothetical protein
MNEKVEWIANQMKKSDKNRVKIDFLNVTEIGKACKFLMSLPC